MGKLLRGKDLCRFSATATMLAVTAVALNPFSAQATQEEPSSPVTTSADCQVGDRSEYGSGDIGERATDTLRVATVDADLTDTDPNGLNRRLNTPGDTKARELAETIQKLDPDVLVLTGFDVDDHQANAEAFRTNYLSVAGKNTAAIQYPEIFSEPSNTGVDSGADLNGDGVVGGEEDTLSAGDFPGQRGMVVYSKHPINTSDARTFSSLMWESMPDSHFNKTDYPKVAGKVLPVSTVGHWDVPVTVDGQTVHVLASSTADPRNSQRDALRNDDEIQLWADYINDASYIKADDGEAGGLESGARFVIAGELNSDAENCSGSAATQDLLDSTQVVDPLADHTAHQTQNRIVRDPAVSVVRAGYVLADGDDNVTNAGVFVNGAGTTQNTWGPSVVSNYFNQPAEVDYPAWADIKLAP